MTAMTMGIADVARLTVCAPGVLSRTITPALRRIRSAANSDIRGQSTLADRHSI
jgi:hypothetical protein